MCDVHNGGGSLESLDKVNLNIMFTEDSDITPYLWLLYQHGGNWGGLQTLKYDCLLQNSVNKNRTTVPVTTSWYVNRVVSQRSHVEDKHANIIPVEFTK